MAEEKLNWAKIKPEEFEKIVLEVSKSAETPAKIGLVLRDQYGIPKAKLVSKKISKILKEKNIPIKTEKEFVLKKIEKLKTHVQKNKHDHTASRAITKQLWALHRIENQ